MSESYDNKLLSRMPKQQISLRCSDETLWMLYKYVEYQITRPLIRPASQGNCLFSPFKCQEYRIPDLVVKLFIPLCTIQYVYKSTGYQVARRVDPRMSQGYYEIQLFLFQEQRSSC